MMALCVHVMVRQLIPARETRTTHEWRKMTSGLRLKTEGKEKHALTLCVEASICNEQMDGTFATITT